MIVTEFVYPYLQPRDRVPCPRPSARHVLGWGGRRPTYRGGLDAYANDEKAHRSYRAWRKAHKESYKQATL